MSYILNIYQLKWRTGWPLIQAGDLFYTRSIWSAGQLTRVGDFMKQTASSLVIVFIHYLSKDQGSHTPCWYEPKGTVWKTGADGSVYLPRIDFPYWKREAGSNRHWNWCYFKNFECILGLFVWSGIDSKSTAEGFLSGAFPLHHLFHEGSHLLCRLLLHLPCSVGVGA